MAEQVFLISGYSDTTMQMVADQAGSSKETLYRHFNSKETLFEEVISNQARRLLAPLDADLNRHTSMESVLRDTGINLLNCMTHPAVVHLMRIVVAETSRDPSIGRMFYEVGPARGEVKLTALLVQAKKRGEFVGRDPALAARIFLGALTSRFNMMRLVLRDEPPSTPDEIDTLVEEVVAMFLLRYKGNGPFDDQT